MNILLVDDEAHKGWKEILEKLFFRDQEIEVALDFFQAREILKSKYFDLIFLDLRFGEIDHVSNITTNYGGYKVLTDLIRHDFNNLSFATPVILFTASNKHKNIYEMLNYGVDDFYIKEHPEMASGIQHSQDNIKRLKGSIVQLLKLGDKRKKICCKINEINEIVNSNFKNENIKKRIDEKLRIGYALLFRRVNTLEKNVLLFNNEVNSFIIFWSVLEEISHEFFGKFDDLDKNWIIKSKSEKIQWFEGDILKSKFPTIKKEFNTIDEVFDVKNANQINLSNQIVALLRYHLEWDHHKIRSVFLDKLNKYRNETDFIHSSTDNILNKEISKTYDSEFAFKRNNDMLDFILKLIK